MNEVTKENFNSIYPQIKDALENATIIAIDSEFTGLESDNISKSSLFDTTDERYAKIRRTIEPFIIIQFGITAFQRIREENKYTAQIFNFFLLPTSIPTKNRQFLWQISAVEFLSSYNFDFNKVAYNGISYLDEIEEAMLKQQLKENTLYQNVENCMPYKDEDDIKDFSNGIAEWLKSSEKNEIYNIRTSSPSLQYLLQKVVRSRFPNIWTISNKDTVTVIKVSEDVRKMLETEEGQVLEHTLLDSYLGFSKVFKLLVELKKPIIGHNILLDLIFMHKLFYRPLPKNYNEFKTEIHKLFPVIYDTKYLSYRLKDHFNEEMWTLNSLSNLYHYFTKGKGNNLILNSPFIEVINSKSTDEGSIHDAGWDSYLTGHIFLKMAHIFAAKKYGGGMEYKILTNTEAMSAVKDYINCINISRANALYLRLDGSDPETGKPQWLFVKTLVPNNFDIDQISKKFLPFGAVDVKPFTRGHALVAVSNHGSVSSILKHFRHNKELYVTYYSPIRHSPSMRYLFISSMLLSGGMLAWVFHRSVQKPI
ncbi:hypothetical protein KPH14_012310 [Odynerus spinipes]|uniref:Uncharacterized protein n=1 Tax=Odynerus spinipes TaxID=1348599 RepID=A0AAD9VMA2_9HYME|nr:hypothetical protein KPH14_012310 [Odynerus spinipes]